MQQVLFHDPKQKKSKKRLFKALFFCLILILIDQWTKTWISQHLLFGQREFIFSQFNINFDLILVYNTGAAFSFLAGESGWQTYFFLGLAFMVSLFLFVNIYKENHSLSSFYMTLIAAGALGNAIDRMIHGHVIDFLLFYYKDYFFPAFNIADICISFGVFLFIIDELFIRQKKRRSLFN